MEFATNIFKDFLKEENSNLFENNIVKLSWDELHTKSESDVIIKEFLDRIQQVKYV